MELLAQPVFPEGFVSADTKLVPVPNERHPQQEWLVGKLLKPSLVRKLRVAKTELVETFRGFIDERAYAELLCESFQLPGRCCSFHEIDEMSLDASLGKETQCLAG